MRLPQHCRPAIANIADLDVRSDLMSVAVCADLTRMPEPLVSSQDAHRLNPLHPGYEAAMSATHRAIYQAASKGAVSEAELRKATKLEDEELTAALDDMKQRLWLSSDDSGKTTKFSLTEEGRMSLGSRYPD
jgi:hypothetical protein